MKFLNFLLLVSLLATVSCSKGSKKENAAADSGDMMSSDADFIVDADNEELIVEDEPLVASEDSVEPIVLDDSLASSDVIMTEDEGSYTVKRGETLMMVAFNLYGDYRKWGSLRDLNGLSGSAVSEGAVIRYKKPSTEFMWNPEGLPYLIKSGDSLVTISNDKYGTANKWKLIYNNNRPLIKDPNLIFAGFTLYYIPEREIASE
ncbi:MAG: LysM peptidoglycan-binding domain-containing protein [Bacteriovoracaceae bacterium]|nr:LysM peptidoglycan-binding domain-containing protein [Bacteriovoracaceae bacterium]